MLLITFDPENRLVARGLETEWENRLRDLAAAETELRRREQHRPSSLTAEQLQRLQILGSDLRQVWDATTTTDRDRKELLRTLLEEVSLNLKRAEGSRAPDSALARRRDYDAGCSCSAIQAHGTTHRRRYDLAAPPSGRSLSR